MKRRSSARITLVLIGTLALTAGCEKEQRNVYKSKEDCVQDWGQGEKCEEVTTSNNHYGGGYYSPGYFYGPTYSGGYSQSSTGLHSTRSVAVARGGFGALAAFHGGVRG